MPQKLKTSAIPWAMTKGCRTDVLPAGRICLGSLITAEPALTTTTAATATMPAPSCVYRGRFYVALGDRLYRRNTADTAWDEVFDAPAQIRDITAFYHQTDRAKDCVIVMPHETRYYTSNSGDSGTYGQPGIGGANSRKLWTARQINDTLYGLGIHAGGSVRGILKGTDPATTAMTDVISMGELLPTPAANEPVLIAEHRDADGDQTIYVGTYALYAFDPAVPARKPLPVQLATLTEGSIVSAMFDNSLEIITGGDLLRINPRNFKHIGPDDLPDEFNGIAVTTRHAYLVRGKRLMRHGSDQPGAGNDYAWAVLEDGVNGDTWGTCHGPSLDPLSGKLWFFTTTAPGQTSWTPRYIQLSLNQTDPLAIPDYQFGPSGVTISRWLTPDDAEQGLAIRVRLRHPQTIDTATSPTVSGGLTADETIAVAYQLDGDESAAWTSIGTLDNASKELLFNSPRGLIFNAIRFRATLSRLASDSKRTPAAALLLDYRYPP